MEFKIPWKLISWENILIFIAGYSGSVSDVVLMLLLNTSPTFKYFLKRCEAWDPYICLDLGSQLRLTVLFYSMDIVKCSKINKKYQPKCFLEYCRSLPLRERQGYRTEIFIWSGWVFNLFLMSRLHLRLHILTQEISPLRSHDGNLQDKLSCLALSVLGIGMGLWGESSTNIQTFSMNFFVFIFPYSVSHLLYVFTVKFVFSKL